MSLMTRLRIGAAIAALLAIACGCADEDHGQTNDAGVDAAEGGTGGAGPEAGDDRGQGGSVNCATVGCAAPPLCSTGCTEVCGCCLCGEGTTQGNLVCAGGCWALLDGAAD